MSKEHLTEQAKFISAIGDISSQVASKCDNLELIANKAKVMAAEIDGDLFVWETCSEKAKCNYDYSYNTLQTFSAILIDYHVQLKKALQDLQDYAERIPEALIKNG
jgi:hypothetical protein